MYVERLFITSGTSTPPAKQRLPRQPLFGPVKEITSPSFSSTTRHEPTGRPLTEKPRSPPAKTAAPQPQTSSSGPSSVTSSAAAPSGLPSIALPRRSAGRSIAPATGTPLDWKPQRPRSCTEVSIPARLTLSSVIARQLLSERACTCPQRLPLRFFYTPLPKPVRSAPRSPPR